MLAYLTCWHACLSVPCMTDSSHRFATIPAASTRTETVRAYLPQHYNVVGIEVATPQDPARIVIEGHDVAGWTLDGYVIPRLASGLIFATECREHDIAWPDVVPA